MTIKLYVGPVELLAQAGLLAQADEIESASVVEDRQTGRSRGFGFVEMASKEEHALAIGDRVPQVCIKCGEERGLIVASISKKGRITRVSCPICGSRVPYKSGVASTPRLGPRYDRSRTYRRGLTAIIEPQRIDVLFADRLRRLMAVNKEGEYVPAGAILLGRVDKLEGTTLMEEEKAREQVQLFFAGFTESRKRAHKMQTEINRLKKKTQAIIDKLA